MKAHVKFLAVAVAMAAGSAQAAIDHADSGNGELVFTIWDKLSQVAYTKDLRFNMDDFLVGGANASTSHSYSLAADTNWATFLGQADEANSFFAVIALDKTGKTVAGGSRYLSTSKNPLSTVDNQTNSPLNAFDGTNSFLTAQNAKGTHVGGDPLVDGSAFTTKAADGNAYPQSTNYNVETWSTKAAGWTTTAKVGEANNFYFLTSSAGNASGALSNVSQYVGGDLSAATWTVDLATNTLNYNVAEVSSIPIPAAAWLLGSALLGLVGVGRRSAKGNVIAA